MVGNAPDASRVVPVVAFAFDRVIGARNALPWRIPEDLRRFKRLTLGHPVVMGRRTFDSIGKPLVERTNVVVTRRPDALAGRGVLAAGSPDEALALAARHGSPVFVIGGAEIYAATLPRAREIEATLVYAEVAGDAFFPALDARWHLVSIEHGTSAPTTGREEPLLFSFARFARDVPCAGCALCHLAPDPSPAQPRSAWDAGLARMARSLVQPRDTHG